jgi:Ca2+-transporting ATPase
LWVNIIQDALPIFALAADPEERGIMQEKPRGRTGSLFTPEMKVLIFGVSFLINFLLLGFVYYFYQTGMDLTRLRTFAFMAISIGAVFHIFACRSLRWPIWRYNPLSNHYLNGTVLLGLLLMLAAVYWPFLQPFLHTAPLGATEWLALLFIGVINLLSVEITKEIFIWRRGKAVVART